MINADGGAKQHTDIGLEGHNIDILMQCFYRAAMKNCNKFCDGCMTPKVVPNKSGKN